MEGKAAAGNDVGSAPPVRCCRCFIIQSISSSLSSADSKLIRPRLSGGFAGPAAATAHARKLDPLEGAATPCAARNFCASKISTSDPESESPPFPPRLRPAAAVAAGCALGFAAGADGGGEGVSTAEFSRSRRSRRPAAIPEPAKDELAVFADIAVADWFR